MNRLWEAPVIIPPHDHLSQVEDVPVDHGPREPDPRRTWLDVLPWLQAIDPADESLDWSDWISPSESADHESRIDRAAHHIMTRLSNWPLHQVFPTWRPGIDLTTLDLPTRARTILAHSQGMNSEQMMALTVTDMADWRQMGVTTLTALMRELTRRAVGDGTPGREAAARIDDDEPLLPTGSDGLTPPPRPPVPHQVDEDLLTIARWHLAVGRTETPLMAAIPDRAQAPPDVQIALDRLAALTAPDILDDLELQEDLSAAIDDAVGALGDRAIDILSARLFADTPLSLRELGERHNVSRERVRQIEARAEAHLHVHLSTGALGTLVTSLAPPARVVSSLIDLIHTYPVLARIVPSVRQPVWRVLDRMDDSYEISGDWCVRPTLTEARSWTIARLRELTDGHGVVGLDDVAMIWPLQPGRRRDLTAAWLEQCGHLVHEDVVLTRTGSLGDYAAGLLSAAGTPLTSEQIRTRLRVTRSARSLVNVLSAEARFTRVDRDTWALTDWDTAAYVGIRAHIAELVGEGGGRALIEEISRSITSRFSVSATSVHAYASAHPFVLRQGVVTFRQAHTPPQGHRVRKTPAQTRRLFRQPDHWAYRVRVTRDLLRGSGSPAPVALSGVLGLEPGGKVTLSTLLGDQSVLWTGAQPTFASIKRFLDAMGAATDVEVFLRFGDDRTFTVTRTAPLVGDPLIDAAALTGLRSDTVLPTEARRALALAIGLPSESDRDSILEAYHHRGDTDIVDQLRQVARARWTSPTATERVMEDEQIRAPQSDPLA